MVGCELPVAPSAIARPSVHGHGSTADGDVAGAGAGIVEQFRRGAENAKAVGFDGVELIDVWGARSRGPSHSERRIKLVSDSNPIPTFSYLAERLNKVGIVYLHVVDSVADGAKRVPPLLHRKFDRAYIV